MNYYQTGEVAAFIGIHPNTVRLYEEWGLIPRPERRENGYRIFTDLHIAQIILLRTAFRVEILQGGLRKSIVTMVKTAAAGNFSQAMVLTHKYLAQLEREHEHAEEAIAIVQQLLSGEEEDSDGSMKRKAENHPLPAVRQLFPGSHPAAAPAIVPKSRRRYPNRIKHAQAN